MDLEPLVAQIETCETINHYQELAERTSSAKGVHYGSVAANSFDLALPETQRLITAAIGLSGESGELLDALKKHLFHKHPLDRTKLINELGDVAWYLSEVASTLGVSLSEVLGLNLRKRMKRYPDGFSPEQSLKRE